MTVRVFWNEPGHASTEIGPVEDFQFSDSGERVTLFLEKGGFVEINLANTRYVRVK